MIQGSQGRNLKAGIAADKGEQGTLFTGLFPAYSACFLLVPGRALSTVIWAHLHQSSINQSKKKKNLTGLPIGQSGEDNFSVEVSPSKMTLAYVDKTQANMHTCTRAHTHTQVHARTHTRTHPRYFFPAAAVRYHVLHSGAL